MIMITVAEMTEEEMMAVTNGFEELVMLFAE